MWLNLQGSALTSDELNELVFVYLIIMAKKKLKTSKDGMDVRE